MTQPALEANSGGGHTSDVPASILIPAVANEVSLSLFSYLAGNTFF